MKLPDLFESFRTQSEKLIETETSAKNLLGVTHVGIIRPSQKFKLKPRPLLKIY